MKRLLISLLFPLCIIVASTANDVLPEIARLREVADSLHSIGRTDSAAIVGSKAVKLAEASTDPTQIVGTRAAQGVFLRSLGRIDEALECYDGALAIITSGKFRDNPDAEAIEEIASLYINLSVLNLDMQHKDQAASNAMLAGEWIAKSGDPELRSVIYGVVGSVLTGCGEPGKAMEYQKLAYKDAIASGDKEAAFRAATYAMLASDRLGKKAESEDWRARCSELLPAIESSMAKLAYYQAECSICLKGKDNKGALKWFDEILKTDGIDGLPFVKFDCYNNMHIAYSDLGDYRNAYVTLLQGNALRDSLWQEEKTESLRDLTVKYETKETELALAQSESKRANTLMWLFAALGLILIGVIFFVVYADRQRRRRLQKEVEFTKLRADIGRQLTEQYVEGLESERKRMSRELHDGVCNDLLAIQMSMKDGNDTVDAVRLLDECRESVRRISHELMPPEFAYASIDEVVRFFVRKQAAANQGKIAISYTSSADQNDWGEIPDSVALEVYRIVQEAVGNAIKHSGCSEIKVSMTLKSGILTVKVIDDGHFLLTRDKGFGLQSIRKRAESIGADIRIDRNEGEDDKAPSGSTTVSLSLTFGERNK